MATPLSMATVKKPRYVRIGESDIKISECWYWPNEKEETGRHWFESADGIQTATYRQMCDRLGGRPKPRLPEDEYRAAPETGTSGIEENSSSPTDAAGGRLGAPAEDAQGPVEGVNWEFFDSRKPVDTYPWTLDERDSEEIPEEELFMQLIWRVEQIRKDEPDLYEAALDSVKRREYLDHLAQRKKLEADSAARCQHIKSDGEPCGSPAIKKRRFCYFHIRTGEERKKSKELQLPVLEDDRAIQMAVTNVCRGLLKGKLEPKYASTVLYGLQVASVAVRKVAATKSRARE